MPKLTLRAKHTALRQHRVRARLHGTAARPRLSVHISNRQVAAQLINDETHVTIAYVTTLSETVNGTMTERAGWVGGEIAKKAAALKVKQVVFDRGAKRYHGRVKALADAARTKGLEF